MARPRKYLRFDDLPLFATDADLATAIVGTDPEKRAMWLAGLPALERRGFPRVTPGFGRYRPAIIQFYDEFYCVTDADGRRTGEAGGAWSNRRSSQRRA